MIGLVVFALCCIAFSVGFWTANAIANRPIVTLGHVVTIQAGAMVLPLPVRGGYRQSD